MIEPQANVAPVQVPLATHDVVLPTQQAVVPLLHGK
jgi:hypothetical protein